jgi:hypothetical protein
MAEIKRLNYFTSQFLIEGDFTGEQAYHMQMRRRHNSVAHTPGVADGLIVQRNSATEVMISPGTAIDSLGREIALQTAQVYALQNRADNQTLFLTVDYSDALDNADKYPPDPTKFVRVTERPVFSDSTDFPPQSGPPPGDGAASTALLLAVVQLNGSGAIESNASIDNSVRTLAGAKVAPLAIGTLQLADGAVTSSKLTADSVDATKIVDGSIGTAELAANAVVTAKILDGAITLTKLAANSVDASRIVDGSVGAAELGANSVVNAKILDGAVTNSKLAANAVDAGKIADNTIGNSKLIDGTIALTKLATQPVVSVEGVTAATGGNIDLVPSNAITIAGNNANKTITIGESHSGTTGNPHGTTAAQVGALPITGGTITSNAALPLFVVNTNAGLSGVIASVGTSSVSFNNAAIVGISSGGGIAGVFAKAPDGSFALSAQGACLFNGAKTGYVVDVCVNGDQQTLRTGDIVKLKNARVARFYGDANKIPVPEVVLADRESDGAVFGIVDREAVPVADAPDPRIDPDDPTSVAPSAELFVVTLGTYAHCKVDAAAGPIKVGDLLTSSKNPGFAMRAIDPKIGTIIGKALEPLDTGTGFIAVFVNML